MHKLTSRLLTKKGIKDVSELTQDEREVFESYERVLSKDKLNIEDIKRYLETQIRAIEDRWKDYGTENARKAELIPYHTVYRSLLQVIDGPNTERENLEQFLNNLIKN